VASLIPFLAFAFGSLVMFAAAMMLFGSRTAAIDRRLEELSGFVENPEESKGRFQSLFDTMRRLGEKAPRSARELGKLRLRLTQAGFRKDEALPIFFGIRVAFAVGLFLLLSTPILVRPNLMMALGGVLAGYLVPGIVLARLAKRRQHRIRLSLADALDLLVVSVEAGLGLDQALMRVATELASSYPDLADELKLRNLADRTGVDDLSSLVTMLIQTDKFGTSIAQSLRVYSDTLRTKRRQRAEEAAAKTGVKMVFPLVFCIFPAVWVVTIGPAAIKIIRVLFPLVESQK
jgi:tight adherence protein C